MIIIWIKQLQYGFDKFFVCMVWPEFVLRLHTFDQQRGDAQKQDWD